MNPQRDWYNYLSPPLQESVGLMVWISAHMVCELF